MMTPSSAAVASTELLRGGGSPTDYIEFADAGHASDVQEVAAFNNAIIQKAESDFSAA